MARSTISDDDWWMFLGVVSRGEDGKRTFTCGAGAEKLGRMERAGFLWLKLRGQGYEVSPTREGVAAVRSWASRRAKEAAVAFARAGG